MITLTRLAIQNLFHPFQTFILGQKIFATKIALKYKIPLVFLEKMKRNMEIQLQIILLQLESHLILHPMLWTK